MHQIVHCSQSWRSDLAVRFGALQSDLVQIGPVRRASCSEFRRLTARREEMLTRMVQRQVPMVMSHIEIICLMLDEVVQESEVVCERVLRVVSELSDKAIMAKFLQQKHFDLYGRLLKTTILIDTVDNATYDQLRTKVIVPSLLQS